MNCSIHTWAKAAVFAQFLFSLLILPTGRALASWPDFPLESSGDLGFAVDGAIFLDQSGKEVVHFFVSLQEENFVCRDLAAPDDSSGQMEIEARLRFLSNKNKILVQRGTELVIPCYNDSMKINGPKRFVYLNSPVDHGTAAFEVMILDKNAQRTGLLYQIKSQKKRGLARGHLRKPDHKDFGAVSGMLMLWFNKDETAFTDANGFQLCDADLGRSLVESNPTGSYGLFRDHVSLYCELYGLGNQSCTVRIKTIALKDSTVILDRSKNLQIPYDRCALIKNLGISNLPAGAYRLELEVLPVGYSGSPLTAANKFQVQWNQDSWIKTQKERVEEAMILLEPDEWKRFSHLEPGRQESYLEDFWRSHEGENRGQLQAVFQQRIITADRLFSGYKRGALTDRGRVFVRFGDPDEITKELNPQEKDWLSNYIYREISSDEADYVGGRPVVNRHNQCAYIVWHYIYRGDPILPHWGSTSGGHSIKFIFVDDHGTGRFRLIYSTLFGGF